jgi:signal peptidase I
VTDVQDPPTTPTPPSGRRHARKGTSRSSFWKELPILLGAAIVVALLVRTFVLQTFYVPSESMEHTLNINDRVLVNKLVYDFRSPARGEVIVFTSPLDWRTAENEKDFVKRVIGVPGDHVTCCVNGHLTINGVQLNEPYLDTDNGGNVPASPSTFNITVPQGRLWVMGDNRVESADSAYHWTHNGQNITESTIPISSVIGRAFVLFWPLGRATWLSVPKGFAVIPNPSAGP